MQTIIKLLDMNQNLTYTLAIILSVFLFQTSNGQNTFEKILTGTGHVQNQGATATSDGGLVLTGILDDDGSGRVFITKMDCQGIVQWTRLLNASSTINNVRQKVVELENGALLLASNVGYFRAYNQILVKFSAQGDVIWEKAMLGSGDDGIADAILTPDGGIAIVGYTNTYGEDRKGSLSFKDVYVTKLTIEGDVQWSKTFGNKGTIDQGKAIINTIDGGFAITGRYIDKGAFQVLLLKLDAKGEMDFIQTFGDTLHRNYAQSIIQDKNGDFVISGSTTLNKDNHQDIPDPFILKASKEGDLLWAKSYIPLENDKSDSGSKIIELDNGYVVTMPTMSFRAPNSTHVQNKFALIFTDIDGVMDSVVTYVPSNAHYPLLTKSPDNSGYYLAGYSTLETPTFSPHIVRMDPNFEGACFTIDRSRDVIVATTPFIEHPPLVVIGEGANWQETTTQVDSLSFTEMNSCEYIETSCPMDTKVDDLYEMNLLTIYPNPVFDILEVELPDHLTNTSSVRVINSNGVIIIDEMVTISSKILELNLTNMPSGLYHLRLINEQVNYHGEFVKVD